MTKYCVVTTTCDKIEIANKIMNTLLEKRLVSCCQMTKVESSYWWEGEIVKEPELLIQMKTKKDLFKEVEKEILSIHDYETCEIISFDINEGNDKYLKWMEDEMK